MVAVLEFIIDYHCVNHGAKLITEIPLHSKH